jgi:hypothetical protein
MDREALSMAVIESEDVKVKRATANATIPIVATSVLTAVARFTSPWYAGTA